MSQKLKIDSYLTTELQKNDGHTVSVIISQAETNGNALISELARVGATEIVSFAGAVKAELSISELSKIAARPDVSFVASNRD